MNQGDENMAENQSELGTKIMVNPSPVAAPNGQINRNPPVSIQVQPAAGWYDRVYSDVANNAFGVILGVTLSLAGLVWLLHWLGVRDLVNRLISHVTLSTRANQRMINNQVIMSRQIGEINERIENIDRNIEDLTERE